MFKSERRFKDTKPWAKDHSLDSQFKELSDDYDIYVIRHWFYLMREGWIMKKSLPSIQPLKCEETWKICR